MNSFEKPKWMTDQAVKEIPEEKLEFLQNLYIEMKKNEKEKSMQSMLSFIKKAKEHKINFSPSEVTLVIATIKKYSSPDELEKIEKFINKKPLH